MEPIFQIEQLRRIGHFNMDTDHFHDFYEIYYLLSGQRHYYIRNGMYALEAGDLVFINKKITFTAQLVEAICHMSGY
ncbi:AraC family ligand binding domain-containing protein [Paenibacillus rhizoplanae]